jgi:hypothetical protein
MRRLLFAGALSLAALLAACTGGGDSKDVERLQAEVDQLLRELQLAG